MNDPKEFAQNVVLGLKNRFNQHKGRHDGNVERLRNSIEPALAIARAVQLELEAERSKDPRFAELSVSVEGPLWEEGDTAVFKIGLSAPHEHSDLRIVADVRHDRAIILQGMSNNDLKAAYTRVNLRYEVADTEIRFVEGDDASVSLIVGGLIDDFFKRQKLV